jgi:hypothetical protein
MDTNYYDESILSLLHRMSNLEKLDLCLLLYREGKTFIDGNDLKLNIINHMPLLNKFTFNIRSTTHFYNQINLPSNEYIQQTFKDFENQQIISSIDYFPDEKKSPLLSDILKIIQKKTYLKTSDGIKIKEQDSIETLK